MSRILIVDDQDQKRRRLVELLLMAGLDVLGATSADALVLVQTDYEIAVALVEMMLQGTNGFEFARTLQRATPEVRVVLTSDYIFTEHQIARVACGAVGFVPQPCATDELVVFLRAKSEAVIRTPPLQTAGR